MLETIEALGCLRSTGMSLADMRVYLRHLDGGDPAEQRDLFARNVERLDAEIARLRVRRDYLRRLKAGLWDARDRGDAAAEERAVDEIRGLLPRLK
ncbi:resistance related regulator [Amycolatopsis methanolica 239]|uniref:Resistance related regulator n=1 Tax=Amycolatopsis methanolica 239 TaxID=1068978 RepID=A0A076MX90_AMYME|nr:resistance related regulator [Amycolatopsis methanolica 239]